MKFPRISGPGIARTQTHELCVRARLAGRGFIPDCRKSATRIPKTKDCPASQPAGPMRVQKRPPQNTATIRDAPNPTPLPAIAVKIPSGKPTSRCLFGSVSALAIMRQLSGNISTASLFARPLAEENRLATYGANARAISIHMGLVQSSLGSAAARAKVQRRRRSKSTSARSARRLIILIGSA